MFVQLIGNVEETDPLYRKILGEVMERHGEVANLDVAHLLVKRCDREGQTRRQEASQ